jgi:hypothetical protein
LPCDAKPPRTLPSTLSAVIKRYGAMDMTFCLPRAEAALAQVGDAGRPEKGTGS